MTGITNVYFTVGSVQYVLDWISPDEFFALMSDEKKRSIVAYPTVYTVVGDDIIVWPTPPPTGIEFHVN